MTRGAPAAIEARGHRRPWGRQLACAAVTRRLHSSTVERD